MSKTSQQLTASAILHTARSKYKTDISLIFGNLVLDAREGVQIAPALVDVVKLHWQLLATHLRQEQPGLNDWLILHKQSPLCSTCLDAKRETRALSDPHDQLMYCTAHHPGLKLGNLWEMGR